MTDHADCLNQIADAVAGKGRIVLWSSAQLSTPDQIRAAADHIRQLETALRRIVASGAYPEAAIAAEALDGAP